MIIALISDIHGNREALEAVLADCERQNADVVHCLGDVVGYGPDPGPCVELVHQECRHRIMGNHDASVLGRHLIQTLNQDASRSLTWTRGSVSEKHLAMLAEYEFQAVDEERLLVHSSPHEPERWHYVLTPEEAITAFGALTQRICFIGHSHQPMIFGERADGTVRRQTGHDFSPDESCRYLINVGSVGQPRDHDARACYLTYDTTEQFVSFHRVTYDVSRTQGKMTEAGLPDRLIARLAQGR